MLQSNLANYGAPGLRATSAMGPFVRSVIIGLWAWCKHHLCIKMVMTGDGLFMALFYPHWNLQVVYLKQLPSGYVKIAIENGDLVRGFTH